MNQDRPFYKKGKQTLPEPDNAAGGEAQFRKKARVFDKAANKVTTTFLKPRDRKRIKVRGSIFSELY